MPINGKAAGILAAGSLLLWSGVKGNSVIAALQDVVKGKKPSGTQLYPITAPAGGSGGSPGGDLTSNNQVADDALQYQGQGYVSGGNGSSPGVWDCSSFFSYVINHDLGVAIPGYKPHAFGGHGHGPVVGGYRIWSGAKNIKASEVQAGDFVCFGINSHMGICLGNGKMISAENPSIGTIVSSISDQHEGLVTYRRLK